MGIRIYQSFHSEEVAEVDSMENTSENHGKENHLAATKEISIQPKDHESVEPDVDEKITSLLESMTLKEKIGQLMVVGFQSTEVDESIKTMIEDYHVGGVILYERNMETPEQVTALNADLQTLAKDSMHGIPLIISVDQEGGDIVRMRDHVSPIPAQQEIGKEGDKEKAFSIAKRSGEELADMGFNVNYAPVLDLSATDTRSFGEDPEKAYQFGKQVITGFAESSVVGTLKHFPGNGRSNIDPHVESSSVDAGKNVLEGSDIYPFKRMIEEVDQNKYFVMVTHFIYPAYDKKLPASISPVIVKQLLREKLGYEGIVVTDDLEMGAVSNLYAYEELGYRAVKAGADLLLVCHTLESQEQVYNGILDAVKNGKLSEAEIDDSVRRVLEFKLG
ncbi:glycoside hydrolase family 3 N-terminal domain-containing protein [Lentibacillus sp. Marseille-P4043]|uniref:glycoside hydrolase family 3 N-terminal domain-containing protein n=1 Tax=Lentibacillus sp. Marseille-P4043 TaxID=2040293 RepID=UPI001F2FCAB6|nr:glycoside hydrolase family 3 N-terminal domain-containing protein [Lentibacillus sp. Marseille-P4043]